MECKCRQNVTVSMDKLSKKSRYLVFWFGITLVPIVASGLFVVFVSFLSVFRYDSVYFTNDRQKLYGVPGDVAVAMEKVLQTGDEDLYAELTGLRVKAKPPEANPNMHFVMLWEIDEKGYFDYLYYDVKTFERAMIYVKEVDNRWVVVPQDAYFYLDSGRWLLTLAPLAALWWTIWLLVGLVVMIVHVAARYRKVYLGEKRSE